MSPYVNWRQAIKARGARGGVSLLIAALGVALILVVTLASQPGSRLPRYLTFGLKRYANSNESAATRPLGAGSVVAPGPGLQIRAWASDASLAGERISASAEWYRKHYLGR